MNELIPSYLSKEFIVLDNDSRIRVPTKLRRFARYRAGDKRPAGISVGDFKIIPQWTRVHIRDVRIDENRNTFLFAEPVGESDAPSGWTKSTNLKGQFVNELASWAPDEWDLPPTGDNFTVTDERALVRSPPSGFRSKGTTIAMGEYLLVTGRSRLTEPEGKYIRVKRAVVRDGEIEAEESFGWTAASNVAPGCSQVFLRDRWLSETGPYGCWRRGRPIGSKVLVNIVGTGGQMEQVPLDSLGAYLRLVTEAAKSHVVLSITSGFRTYAKQEQLYKKFKERGGNLAARPGRSNHQHGQAFDLNTGGFDGDGVYDWLKRFGPKFGFIRTVNREHWHWEYRPEDAASLAALGEFALSSVRV